MTKRMSDRDKLGSESVTAASTRGVQGQIGESGEPRHDGLAVGGYVTRSEPRDALAAEETTDE